MERARFYDYFPEDVVFLSDFYGPAGLAENILNDFCTGLYVLTIFDQQQRNIFIHLVALFWYPEQGAAFDDFVAKFSFAALVDFYAAVFDYASCCCAVAVVEQFGDDFSVDDFAPGSGFARKPLLRKIG